MKLFEKACPVFRLLPSVVHSDNEQQLAEAMDYLERIQMIILNINYHRTSIEFFAYSQEAAFFSFVNKSKGDPAQYFFSPNWQTEVGQKFVNDEVGYGFADGIPYECEIWFELVSDMGNNNVTKYEFGSNGVVGNLEYIEDIIENTQCYYANVNGKVATSKKELKQQFTSIVNRELKIFILDYEEMNR